LPARLNEILPEARLVFITQPSDAQLPEARFIVARVLQELSDLILQLRDCPKLRRLVARLRLARGHVRPLYPAGGEPAHYHHRRAAAADVDVMSVVQPPVEGVVRTRRDVRFHRRRASSNNARRGEPSTCPSTHTRAAPRCSRQEAHLSQEPRAERELPLLDAGD
jgi:hypothetical protein